MTYDIVCIGNPLLDLTFEVDDNFLESLNFEKGRMHLVDESQSNSIQKMVEDLSRFTSPGGSSANVAAGVSVLGGNALFIGSVGNDDRGKKYEFLSEEAGVKTHLKKSDFPTGHAITFITHDYERTFATFLGACLQLRKEDIKPEHIINSKVLHIEGFQFENPEQTEASVYAMKIAKENRVTISIDLADSAFIEQHTELLKDIISNYADIVFLNSREAFAFTGERDPSVALKVIGEICDTSIITLGTEGSLIMKQGEIHKIPAFRVEEVNTNGAGDMYDAGFLYSMTKGLDVDTSGKIASYCASRVVTSHGARVDNISEIELERIVGRKPF